ncbi:MAG: hypothetical protein K940chlam3_01499 [Chlamydiae bacterium]|nr:hypothetical protein [Chlamydiota bacterium]
MEEKKWPAVTIQGILLAANIAFLLAGQHNHYIIASFTILMFLFTVQSTSVNTRFLYLYPVNISLGIPTPSWDTWILRISIVAAVFFFYWGATESYKVALLIVIVGLGFSVIWDRSIEKHNRKHIERLVADKS